MAKKSELVSLILAHPVLCATSVHACIRSCYKCTTTSRLFVFLHVFLLLGSVCRRISVCYFFLCVYFLSVVVIGCISKSHIGNEMVFSVLKVVF